MNQLLFTFAVIMFGWFVINTIYYFKHDYFVSKGFKLYYGLVLVYKKSKEIKKIEVIKKISIGFVILYVIAIFFFFYSMISGVLIKLGYLKYGVAPQLLIPGINITGMQLVYFILAVVIAAFVHELSHAYTARSYGIKVRSIGFAIIFFVPIAFTEIDEESLTTANKKAKIATLAAGPASNLILALIFMFILLGMASTYGLLVINVEQNSLAEKYGIVPGTILLEINNTKATLTTLHNYLALNETTTLELKVLYPNNTVGVIHILKPGNVTKLGVWLRPVPKLSIISSIGLVPALTIFDIINWNYIVNLGLSLINAAPLFISDGGRIMYELFGRRIGLAVNVLGILLLVLAVTIPY